MYESLAFGRGVLDTTLSLPLTCGRSVVFSEYSNTAILLKMALNYLTRTLKRTLSQISVKTKSVTFHDFFSGEIPHLCTKDNPIQLCNPLPCEHGASCMKYPMAECRYTNTREYQRGDQKWAIHRNR